MSRIRRITNKTVAEVFGKKSKAFPVIQTRIEDAVSQLQIQHTIQIAQLPESVLLGVAMSATWYISDNSLRLLREELTEDEFKQCLVTYLLEKHQELQPYRRLIA